MKNALSIVLFMLLSLTIVSAQPPADTGEPAATPQATAPAVVEAEPPPEVIEKTEDTTAPVSESGIMMLVMAVMNVILSGIVLVMAFLNHRSVSKETINTFFAGLRGLAKLIPGDTDDKIVAGIEAGVNTVIGATAQTTVEKSTMTVAELTAG